MLIILLDFIFVKIMFNGRSMCENQEETVQLIHTTPNFMLTVGYSLLPFINF